MSDPCEVITWRGHKFDRLTVAAIEEAEHLYGRTLVISQGSYNTGGVGASAGTHDGGGAVDFNLPSMPTRLVRILRMVGFAAWQRDPSQGPWGAHIHAVLIGNKKLAPVAARQVEAYREGRDGLASGRVDPTWHPTPIPTFVYPEDRMALILTDLRATADKHKVSLVYLARVALFGAKSTGHRAVAVRAARALLKPYK